MSFRPLPNKLAPMPEKLAPVRETIYVVELERGFSVVILHQPPGDVPPVRLGDDHYPTRARAIEFATAMHRITEAPIVLRSRSEGPI